MAVDRYNTKALLHFEGADASTTFTDESGKVWTARGNAQIDTAQFKFTTASGLFDGTDDWIDTPDHEDWWLSTVPFTIDYWCRFNSITTDQPWVGQAVDANNRLTIQARFDLSPKQFIFYCNTGGSALAHYIYQWTTVATATWYHIEIGRNGSNLYLFINGAAITWTTITTPIAGNSLPDYAALMNIGGSGVAGWTEANGWMDEFRWTKGDCLHTSAFTPQTTPYTNVSSVGESLVVRDAVTQHMPWWVTTIAEALGLKDEAAILAEILEILDWAGGSVKRTSIILDVIAIIVNAIPPNWRTIWFNKVLLDVFAETDLSRYFWPVVLDETLLRTDTQLLKFTKTIIDLLVRINVVGGGNFYTRIQDVMSLYEITANSWVKRIAEAIVLTHTIKGGLGRGIADNLLPYETVSPNWRGTRVFSDGINFSDITERLSLLVRVIADTLTATDSAKKVMAVAVLEYLILLELAINPMRFSWVLAEGVGLTDEVKRVWQRIILDAIQALCAAVVKAELNREISDSIAVVSASTYYIQFEIPALDKLISVDALSLKQTLKSLISDSFGFGVNVFVDGDLWQCWILNTKEFKPSVFSNFNFNSFCNFLGSSWGIKSDGLYKLTGTTDAGTKITPGVILNSSNFGVESKKYFRSAFFGLVGGTVPAIKVMNEDNSYKIYSISTNGRANIGREIDGRYLTVSISDFDSLDFVEIIPVVLVR